MMNNKHIICTHFPAVCGGEHELVLELETGLKQINLLLKCKTRKRNRTLSIRSSLPAQPLRIVRISLSVCTLIWNRSLIFYIVLHRPMKWPLLAHFHQMFGNSDLQSDSALNISAKRCVVKLTIARNSQKSQYFFHPVRQLH